MCPLTPIRKVGDRDDRAPVDAARRQRPCMLAGMGPQDRGVGTVCAGRARATDPGGPSDAAPAGQFLCSLGEQPQDHPPSSCLSPQTGSVLDVATSVQFCVSPDSGWHTGREGGRRSPVRRTLRAGGAARAAERGCRATTLRVATGRGESGGARAAGCSAGGGNAAERGYCANEPMGQPTRSGGERRRPCAQRTAPAGGEQGRGTRLLLQRPYGWRPAEGRAAEPAQRATRLVGGKAAERGYCATTPRGGRAERRERGWSPVHGTLRKLAGSKAAECGTPTQRPYGWRPFEGRGAEPCAPGDPAGGEQGPRTRGSSTTTLWVAGGHAEGESGAPRHGHAVRLVAARRPEWGGLSGAATISVADRPEASAGVRIPRQSGQ